MLGAASLLAEPCPMSAILRQDRNTIESPNRLPAAHLGTEAEALRGAAQQHLPAASGALEAEALAIKALQGLRAARQGGRMRAHTSAGCSQADGFHLAPTQESLAQASSCMSSADCSAP